MQICLFSTLFRALRSLIERAALLPVKWGVVRDPQRDGGRQLHMGKNEGKWQPGTSGEAGRDEGRRSCQIADLVLSN